MPWCVTCTYHELTPQTVHQVKRVLVDTLACAMGGYLSEPAKIARHLASTVQSDGDHGSRILGTRECSSPELAGWANAVMVRYLDYNDMSVGGHPSDSIPGPLVVAYPRGSDGRAVITAIVANYEVARQVGSTCSQPFSVGGTTASCARSGRPAPPGNDGLPCAWAMRLPWPKS